MKKISILVALLFVVSVLYAGTPIIDGTFDGEAVWDSAVATADGVVGFADAGVNINKMYVTYDDTYSYYAGSFNTDGYPGGWMRGEFAINVTSGGGGSDPWGSAVTYGYAPDDMKPDFVLVCRFQDNWAELRSWNGSDWDGGGVNVNPADMAWAGDYSYVEGRILKSTMGNPADCDVQFYVSGNNATEHGVFDACPDDEVAQDWNWPTTLDNYATDITLPVELSAFTAVYMNEFVTVSWQTATETDVIGYNIFRSEEDDFSTVRKVNISIIPGHGTTTTPHSYEFTDPTADPYYTTYYYWLEVVNFGGTNNIYGSIEFEPVDVDQNGEMNIITSNLLPSFPNPARIGQSVTFNFCLGGMEGTVRPVELNIYNVLGQCVAEVVNDERVVNNYSVEWNTENFGRGIYFYQLKTEDYQETKRLMID